jgi:hypothetical protein
MLKLNTALVVIFAATLAALWPNGAFAQTPLTLGIPSNGSLPAMTTPYFLAGFRTVNVFEANAKLTIELFASSEVDLYVRFGEDVDFGREPVVADYISRNPGGDELVTISLPRPGTYFIALGVSSVSVTISYVILATTTPLPNILTVPQLASGTGWSTTLFLNNVSTVAEGVTLRFFGEDGNSRQVPIVGMAPASSISATLRPGEIAVYETTAAGPLAVGWASLTPSTPNTSRISGFAIFRFRGAGAPEAEAIVPFSNIWSQNVTMLYDQTNGFSTGLALVNPGQNTVSLSVAIRDQSGATIGVDTVRLPPFSHQASFVSERYPITANGHGSLLITSDGGISALGLRFSPSGTFTSFPPVN